VFNFCIPSFVRHQRCWVACPATKDTPVALRTFPSLDPSLRAHQRHAARLVAVSSLQARAHSVSWRVADASTVCAHVQYAGRPCRPFVDACSGWRVVRLDRDPTRHHHQHHQHMSGFTLGDFRIMKSVCGCASCAWQAQCKRDPAFRWEWS